MGTRTHIYSLEISLAGCCHDVRVNDVPIFRDMDEGYPMTAAMAVNEYLTDGVNSLSVALRPQPGNDGLDPAAHSFTLSLLGRPAGSPKTTNFPLVVFHLTPGRAPDQLVRVAGTGSGLLSVGGHRHAGDGQASLDLTADFTPTGDSFHWAWQDSGRIDPGPRHRDSLRALFADWTARLAGRDASWLLPALRERNQELAQALFEPLAAVEAHGLFDAVADPQLALFDPDLAGSEMRVFGNGRLAQLVRWDGTPVIVFLEADRQSARYYPFTFRMGPQGWIVCR